MNSDSEKMQHITVVGHALGTLRTFCGHHNFEDLGVGMFGISGVPRDFNGFHGDDLMVEPDSVERLFDRTISTTSKFGRVDLFIESAGGYLFGCNFHTPPDHYDEDECHLELTVLEDTPANRETLRLRYSEKVFLNVCDMVRALRGSGQEFSKRLSQISETCPDSEDGPSMG